MSRKVENLIAAWAGLSAVGVSVGLALLLSVGFPLVLVRPFFLRRLLLFPRLPYSRYLAAFLSEDCLFHQLFLS